MVPVIEAGQFDEEVFLADSPRNLIDSLHPSTQVPTIIGVNNDEGMFFMSGEYMNCNEDCYLNNIYIKVFIRNICIQILIIFIKKSVASHGYITAVM